jgi:hypothetical protein
MIAGKSFSRRVVIFFLTQCLRYLSCCGLPCFSPLKKSVAIASVIFTALLSAFNVYLEIHDWTMVAFFLSSALVYILGTVIEQFKVKHWSLSYLAILLVSSSVLSFFLLQVSILGSYPFAVIGWIVFTLPFVINISYNLLRVSREQQLRNL